MPQSNQDSSSGKKMAVIAGYFKDETYGLLGPQMAATIIQDNSPYECIVIAVTNEDDKMLLKAALAEYFGKQQPVIGFSALSGRQDLFSLAGELKDEGAVTLLAGPQAGVDFLGEENWQNYPHRFKGLSQNFSFGLHGPAEQALLWLKALESNNWQDIPGLLYTGSDGAVIQNPRKEWDETSLGKVRWDNLYMLEKSRIVPLTISMGQVLQHIGCPHAVRMRETAIDYPASMNTGKGQQIKVPLKGCSFCDVAVDKGFHGKLDLNTVMSQIQCLPEDSNGKKIAFELINENPLPDLPDLLQEANKRGLRLSQINLTLRADWFISGVNHFREALRMAGESGIYILLSSIGFESFDDTILQNLNKGLSVENNLQAIRELRQLKDEFPHQMGYSTRDRGNHGFIHPTPWDTRETSANIQKNISLYGLQNDILPPYSTPLIIHHASGLGDWIREIEKREGIWFKRYGSIIGWWEEPNQKIGKY